VTFSGDDGPVSGTPLVVLLAAGLLTAAGFIAAQGAPDITPLLAKPPATSWPTYTLDGTQFVVVAAADTIWSFVMNPRASR
jgi:hypothetical protein